MRAKYFESFFQTHIFRLTGQFSLTQFLVLLLSKSFSTSRVRWVFNNFKRLFFCDEIALWFAKSDLLLTKLVCDKSSEWYFCQLFPETQIIFPLICFFVFFHATLLPAINFTGLGWLAWLLSGDSKSERSQCFLVSNTSKYVNALKSIS